MVVARHILFILRVISADSDDNWEWLFRVKETIAGRLFPKLGLIEAEELNL